MAERSVPDAGESGRTSRDRSPVNWLLLVPMLLVIWPPLFNKISPTLFGIPFFYWYLMAWVLVTVVLMIVVNRFTEDDR